ncbi:SOS response-associated peptidase family protein [Serratia sp. Res13-Sevr-LER1-36-a]|uniref:SOS response-associated peptidase family protein n=1 Tax=unclassified Serratia (in: enterobacteria) TaxID=2647522 RepID=UPI00351C60BF
MFGRFALVQTRVDYLDVLASELEVASGQDNVPIDRYNVAPGTRVILLNQRDGKIYMAPVNWGYGPDWWLEI